MGSIRIRHHAELFVVFDQFVDQQLKCLVVAIVITGSVYQQKVAFQLFREVDR